MDRQILQQQLAQAEQSVAEIRAYRSAAAADCKVRAGWPRRRRDDPPRWKSF